MQAVRSFSCSLAITRSNLFGLHLGREALQKPFYTCVTHVFSFFVCDLVFLIHVVVYWEHTRRGSMKKIWLGKYHFPAKCHFVCCKSQRFYYIIGWWYTAWAWWCQNCPKKRELSRGPKQAIRQNAPLLCRILILRKISSEFVLSNEEPKLPWGGP